jgi:hypothetical protein
MWKDKIKKSNEHLGFHPPNDYSIKIDNKLTDIEQIPTREIYCQINIDNIKPATSKSRWIELYIEMDFENLYWELIYETPFKLTKNAKVQMTQYKIIHRILAVNHNLKKWDKIDDETCDYCSEIDTIEHFLYQCPKTTKLWEAIQTWWKTNFDFKIDISVLEIIFGLPNENNDKTINLYNYIILYAKYYIYVTKKKGKPLFIFDFLLTIKKELTYKKERLAELNQTHKFNDIWGELYNYL